MGVAMVDRIHDAIRGIMQSIDSHSHTIYRRTGLTAPQLSILVLLADRGALSVGEIADNVHLSQATVSGIIDRLAEKGLVSRQRGNDDRRKVRVQLTAEGSGRAAEAPPLLHPEFVRMFENDLEDWEQRMILSSLQRLASMMPAAFSERRGGKRVSPSPPPPGCAR